MGDRPQKLGNPWRILAVPEQIAAQLDHGGGQRIEKPARRKADLDRIARALLAGLILRCQCDGHRQVGPRVGREILHQRLFKVIPRPCHRQRQRNPERRGALGRQSQPVAALKPRHIQRDHRFATRDPVIVHRLKRHRKNTARRRLGRPCGLNKRQRIRTRHNLPAAPALTGNLKHTILNNLKALFARRNRAKTAKLRRNRLAHRKRPRRPV